MKWGKFSTWRKIKLVLQQYFDPEMPLALYQCGHILVWYNITSPYCKNKTHFTTILWSRNTLSPIAMWPSIFKCDVNITSPYFIFLLTYTSTIRNWLRDCDSTLRCIKVCMYNTLMTFGKYNLSTILNWWSLQLLICTVDLWFIIQGICLA